MTCWSSWINAQPAAIMSYGLPVAFAFPSQMYIHERRYFSMRCGYCAELRPGSCLAR